MAMTRNSVENFSNLAATQPVAWAVMVFSVVAVLGLALAGIKVKGVGIGIAGVLFAGILAGHAGVRVETGILEFVREFGLILFVFTIGLQLGPSFFASLRRAGCGDSRLLPDGGRFTLHRSVPRRKTPWKHSSSC